MAVSRSGIFVSNRRRKKTRQGNGRGTKFSTRAGSKRFKKKKRGQGKWVSIQDVMISHQWWGDTKERGLKRSYLWILMVEHQIYLMFQWLIWHEVKYLKNETWIKVKSINFIRKDKNYEWILRNEQRRFWTIGWKLW